MYLRCISVSAELQQLDNYFECSNNEDNMNGKKLDLKNVSVGGIQLCISCNISGDSTLHYGSTGHFGGGRSFGVSLVSASNNGLIKN